ncbi:RNA polymerase sigma-70 factor (ECF subfamily) [Kribbella antiqua]|uniref:RNA polymerase sigma-70 factor (ECF subfamily) n=1 Tax=Kribbella antiqua TaxID=2512217 RepID=A0A4R2IBL2_9ACTN|nr:sigma-70 family RNA polymerase sigma factor [Kribbella antiqua]TCO41522.1 RNA polymerase sigma-70 factor (ECF subfamily) [Kribbella antiqua]
MTLTPIKAPPGPVSEGVVHDPPRGGRRERFEELFGAHREAVLGYLRRRTDSGHDAADLLADTFLVAWRRLDDIPPGNQTRPWLYGVARRTLANHRRGEGRRHALATKLRQELTDLDSMDRSLPDDTPAARAFRALPEQERELLSLVAWEELDIAQIAITLGISQNAVRIRLHRARKRFAKLITAPLANRSLVSWKEDASHEDA